MAEIISGLTRAQKNGKNTNGDVRFSVWLPRKVVTKLKVEANVFLFYSFRRALPDEIPDKNKQGKDMVPVKQEVALTDSEKEFLALVNHLRAEGNQSRIDYTINQGIGQFGEWRMKLILKEADK